MEDTYLPAFRATVMEGKAQSVMCAYNSLNGQPACANTMLLEEHLRHDWEFKGYVVSDCGAMADIFSGPPLCRIAGGRRCRRLQGRYRSDLRLSPADAECGRRRDLQAVQQGSLPEPTSIGPASAVRSRASGWECSIRRQVVPYSKITAAENDTPAHAKLALQAARESIVLLKNRDGFLPLKKQLQTIAVIGPNADSLDALEGNYNGTPSKPVTVLAGIRRRFPHSQVVYVQGTGLIGPVIEPIPATALFTDRHSQRSMVFTPQYFSNPKLERRACRHAHRSQSQFRVGLRWRLAAPLEELFRSLDRRACASRRPRLPARIHRAGWLPASGSTISWWSRTGPRTARQPLKRASPSGEGPRLSRSRSNTSRPSVVPEARLLWSVPGKQEQEAVTRRQGGSCHRRHGLSARIEGEEMNVHAEGFPGGDRTSIDLPAPQQHFWKNLCDR